MATRVKPGLRIVSDGTVGGTKVTLADGTPISTISKVTFTIDGEEGFGRAIIELVVPEVELELPAEDVAFKVASIKRCDKCGGITKPEIFVHVNEGRKVRYTCTVCNHQMEYKFQYQWDPTKDEGPPEIDMDSLNKSIEESDTDGGN